VFTHSQSKSIGFLGGVGRRLYNLEWRPHLECLLVCRQIYAEAAFLPFSLRTFNFRCAPSTTKSIIKLMQPLQLATVQVLALDPVHFFSANDLFDLETTFEGMTGLKTVYLRRYVEPSLFTDLVDDIVSSQFKRTGRRVMWIPHDSWTP
jgi:hypothetical protein